MSGGDQSAAHGGAPLDPLTALERGRAILDPVLVPCGFTFVGPEVATDAVASGAYVRDNRRLELAYRSGALGHVVYQVGEHRLAHEAYMRLVLGPEGSNEYPGFAKDPMMAFHHLAHDLEHYAAAFVSGSDEHFAQIVRLSEAQSSAGNTRPFLRA